MVFERNSNHIESFYSWKEKNNGVRIKSYDTIPINYCRDHAWGTLTTAITTRNTDEAKAFKS
jgi:hypothetical protein